MPGQRNHPIFRFIDVAIALAALLGVALLANLGELPRGIEQFLSTPLSFKNLLVLFSFVFIWSVVFESCSVYASHGCSYREGVARILKASLLASAVLPFLPLAALSHTTRIWAPLACWAIAFPLLVAGRYIVNAFLRTLLHGYGQKRNLIIVGSGPRALALYREIAANPRLGYHFLGFVDDIYVQQSSEAKAMRLGSFQDLERLLMTNIVDEVLIALPIKSYYDEIQDTICLCEKCGVQCEYLADVFHFTLARPEYHSGEPSIVSLKMVSGDYRVVVKRLVDFLGSVAGIIILSPVFLAVALAVKLTSNGPVLFTQLRYGHNKRLFQMYKFRSMVANAEHLQGALESKNEAGGPIFKIKADPRITRVGRVLRKSSLDELPQLLNVLKGEMSLVGPRPMSMRDVSRFDDASLMRRFSVKPGITCLWQVNGRSNTTFDHWIKLDLQYIDEWSLGLDMKILAQTLPAVLRGTGAV